MKIIDPGRFVKLSSPENFEFHYIKYSRQCHLYTVEITLAPKLNLVGPQIKQA